MRRDKTQVRDHVFQPLINPKPEYGGVALANLKCHHPCCHDLIIPYSAPTAPRYKQYAGSPTRNGPFI